MSIEGDGDRPRRGAPSNSRLSERLARVEEKQDHVIEQIDHVARTLDDDLSTLETTVDVMKPRHDRLWYTYQAVKWGTGIVVSGGLAGRAFGLF